MSHFTKLPGTTRWLLLVGCMFLTVMAVLHGSGLGYVTQLVNDSNVATFYKEVAPVLFIHPSLHLLELAALGILTLFLRPAAVRKVAIFLAIAILVDSMLAFYLQVFVPGFLLLVPALLFLAAGLRTKTNPPTSST